MKRQSVKPRILYVITQGHWGGAQRYIFDLAMQNRHAFDITVAVGSAGDATDLQKKLAPNNICIVQLHSLQRAVSPLVDIKALFELRKLYKQISPNIIHLNSSKAGILGSLAAAGLKAVIVYTAHGWVFHEPMSRPKQTLYQFLEAWTSKFKDAIIVLSKFDREAGKKIGISEKKIHTIPITVPAGTAYVGKEDARKKIMPTIPANAFCFGVIANFYKTKGIDVLFNAIASNKRLCHIPVAVIGDGPERSNLERQIKHLELTNIHLLGFIENAALYLKAFDALVIPSRKEGLPYIMLDALNARVPIIATNVGGIHEYIEDKKTGLLVQPDNFQALSIAMDWAARHPQIGTAFSHPSIQPAQNTEGAIVDLYKRLLT